MSSISRDISREVGVLIGRRGDVRSVVVGEARSLFLPDLSRVRVAPLRLRGLRLIHTHLTAQPLTEDDLTDLALLRLDTIGAVEVDREGRPVRVHLAHLLPPTSPDGPTWECLAPMRLHELPHDYMQTVEALEEEMTRVASSVRRSEGGADRAILVQVVTGPGWQAEESMSELRELAAGAGLHVVDEVVQRRSRIDPRTVLGHGRLKQLVIRAMHMGAEALVFETSLAPGQLRTVADLTTLKVVDRTQVVLDIFAQRAHTREAKTQVELAQLRYLLPRLFERSTAMSRLTGGIGLRGPGETKLEVDRRRTRDRVAWLEREVKQLGARRSLRRARRTRRHLPTVAIIGYTNAGKSTLLNTLTRSCVTARDMPFATLNPASRRLRLPREQDVIVTDTVGFIRNLPKDLVAAFETTLEEVHEADLLVHVIDGADLHIQRKVESVEQTLRQMDLDRKPRISVLNKIDLVDDDSELAERAETYDSIPVCARSAKTLAPFLDRLGEMLLQQGLHNGGSRA
jgi:GTP-binding protein HflX